MYRDLLIRNNEFMDAYQNKIKVVITGGGSGGHVEPAYAVAMELIKNKDVQVFWIGEKSASTDMVAKDKLIDFHSISAGKIRRYASLTNVSDAFKTTAGFLQAMKILVKIKPDVLFSKSGFVSAPVVMAAHVLRVPIVIHESDIVPGLTSKFSARFAKRVCCGFPTKFYPNWIKGKLVYTGNPTKNYKVSASELHIISNKFNLGSKNIVIFGGSLGSTFINQLLWSNLNQFTSNFNIIHQVGRANLDQAMKTKESLSIGLRANYHPVPFLATSELAVVLSKSVLAISRSGAGTLSDLSYFKVPAVLIPLPTSASDHQRGNAKYVENLGGAIYCEQDELNCKNLFDMVRDLISDKTKLNKMSQEMFQCNPKDAAAHIAKIILGEAKR